MGDTVSCKAEETVLTAILGSGATVTFGCRGGGCGTCKMRMISGHIDHGRYSAAVLPEDEKTSGWFLSCQARALSDLPGEVTAGNKDRVVIWLRRLNSRDSPQR